MGLACSRISYKVIKNRVKITIEKENKYEFKTSTAAKDKISLEGNTIFTAFLQDLAT